MTVRTRILILLAALLFAAAMLACNFAGAATGASCYSTYPSCEETVEMMRVHATVQAVATAQK